jgi:hypothetical protein
MLTYVLEIGHYIELLIQILVILLRNAQRQVAPSTVKQFVGKYQLFFFNV